MRFVVWAPVCWDELRFLHCSVDESASLTRIAGAINNSHRCSNWPPT